MPKHFPKSSPTVTLHVDFSNWIGRVVFPLSVPIVTVSSFVLYSGFSALTKYTFPHSTEKVYLPDASEIVELLSDISLPNNETFVPERIAPVSASVIIPSSS